MPASGERTGKQDDQGIRPRGGGEGYDFVGLATPVISIRRFHIGTSASVWRANAAAGKMSGFPHGDELLPERGTLGDRDDGGVLQPNEATTKLYGK